MAIRNVALVSLITTLAVFSAFYLLALPPKAWAHLDYENMDLEELRVSVPGFAEEHAFKDGFGWIDRTLFVENRLRVLEGVSPNAPDDRKIALVFIERWVIWPSTELTRVQQEAIYHREGYDIIGGV